MKILYAVSEALPFISTGGLGDVGGSLPVALRKRMAGCRVVLPLYAGIRKEMRDKLKFVTHFTVPVSWRNQYCGVFELNENGVIYYLLDNQYYFQRDGLYGHYDDAERFAFFSRAVLELCAYTDFKPDIVHCNDWQTALIPVYHSLIYAKQPEYTHIKTVLTIHNIQYQGIYSKAILGDVFGIGEEHADILTYNGSLNLLKGGIECADRVTTVSPTYAAEILDPWYSHGLDSILNARRFKLRGILNGIDTVSYNPETDKNIFVNYSAAQPQGKAENKAALQKLLGLPVKTDAPLIGIVSRLVQHKGFDLVKEVLEELLNTSGAQLAVLGSGDFEYENFFASMAEKYPDRFKMQTGFVPEMARKIYAGSDIFLMPSKSEPCGLSQMIALRYGSIPVVRETGGLKDSITDNADNGGNGFVFTGYNAQEMLQALRRALESYNNKENWRRLVSRALASDNSWSHSAAEYMRLYREITV